MFTDAPYDPLPNPLPEGRGNQDVPGGGALFLFSAEGEPSAVNNSLSLQGEGRGEGRKARYKKGGVGRNTTANVKVNAKKLRADMTEVEKKLWYHLRAQRFESYKFRRQHPLGNYIVDFVCLKEKLIIELDGGQHAKHSAYDTKRTQYFQEQGFQLLRFWNNDITENLHGVLEIIQQRLT